MTDARETTGRSVFRGGVWWTASRTIPQLYVLALSLVAARFLGPTGMGRQSFIAFTELSLVALVGFDDAYTFKFSPREGTPATRLKDPVPDAVAGERLERLVAVVRGIARRRNVALVGSTHEVLVEGRAKRGELLQGRTRTNKVALIAGPDAWIGGYRDVRFTGTTGSTFTAVPLGRVQGGELAVVG